MDSKQENRVEFENTAQQYEALANEYQVIKRPALDEEDYAIKNGRAINVHGPVDDVVALQTRAAWLEGALGHIRREILIHKDLAGGYNAKAYGLDDLLELVNLQISNSQKQPKAGRNVCL